MAGMRFTFTVLLAATLGVPAAAGPEDPRRPTLEERAWLQRCLDAADPGDPASGTRCVGVLTRACLGHEDPEVPRLRQPEGRGGHPRSCAPIETALWDEWLERWSAEALDAVPAGARAALHASQAAWSLYRAASCQVEALMQPGFRGRDLAADCARDLVAARALDLRRIATLAREARN